MASWAIEVAGRFFPEGLGNFDAHVLENGDEALAHLDTGRCRKAVQVASSCSSEGL